MQVASFCLSFVSSPAISEPEPESPIIRDSDQYLLGLLSDLSVNVPGQVDLDVLVLKADKLFGVFWFLR